MSADMPRVGDTITTTEQLDALPVRSRIAINSGDDVLTKVNPEDWCGGPYAVGGHVWVGEPDVPEDYLPVVVLYVPGEPPRPSVINDAHADAERSTIGLARALAAWDQGEDTTDRIPHWAVNLAIHLRELGWAARAETTTEDATQRLARAAFAVDSKHHFYGAQGGRPMCACGFVGDARMRTQTEHITAAVLEEYDLTDPSVTDDARAEVVCICGSTRFRAEMTEANRRLTMAGAVVLAPGVFGHDGDPLTDEDKERLDALHLRKIDMADRVVVVAPGGYIGESTSREVAYAKDHGKPVEVWSELSAVRAETTAATVEDAVQVAARALLNTPGDDEDCEPCSFLDRPCPYHQGQIDGLNAVLPYPSEMQRPAVPSDHTATVEDAARVLWDHDHADQTPEWREMAWNDMGGSEKNEERVAYELAALDRDGIDDADAVPALLDSQSTESEAGARALEQAADHIDWRFEVYTASDGYLSIREHGRSPEQLLRERAARIRGGEPR